MQWFELSVGDSIHILLRDLRALRGFLFVPGNSWSPHDHRPGGNADNATHLPLPLDPCPPARCAPVNLGKARGPGACGSPNFGPILEF
jgi:hypothetical protein